MGITSIWHFVIVLLAILVLFGAGKLPSVMGDVAKGVRAFRNGMREGDAREEDARETPVIGSGKPPQAP